MYVCIFPVGFLCVCGDRCIGAMSCWEEQPDNKGMCVCVCVCVYGSIHACMYVCIYICFWFPVKIAVWE